MAIRQIINKVEDAKDEDLEKALEMLYGDYAGYNYDIVSQEVFDKEYEEMREIYRKLNEA